MNSKLVLVERFDNHVLLEKRLNSLANDPTNRYDLKFFTETNDGYTIILVWTPEEKRRYD